MNNKHLIALFFIVSLLPSFVVAEQFAIRAREHFDSHTYEVNNVKSKYTGLSNTINVWLEEPYKWAYGFAFGPVIGSANEKDNNQALGDEVHLLYAGFEGKYFPLHSREINLFLRAGIYHHVLDIEGPQDRSGMGYYGGLGYEFKTKNFGIAPEFAIRKVSLSRDTDGTIVTPSIGFHFYDMVNL